MLHELGISASTVVIIMVLLYFVVKWAVRSGIAEAYRSITGKETAEEQEVREMMGLEKTEEV